MFLGRLDPQVGGGFSLADCLGPGLAVGHAAWQFRDLHHVGGILDIGGVGEFYPD